MSRRWLAAAAVLTLTACATTKPPGPALPTQSARTPVVASAQGMAALPGWDSENHAAAFAALQSDCASVRNPSLAGMCGQAEAAGRLGERAARAFLETHLRPESIAGEGLLTAYFAPVYEARERADAEFSAPVRPRPADLAAAGARTEIEAAPAAGALAWMRPEDLFFLQIQGSGVLTFADGRRSKALFDGSNGAPFVGVAAPMAAMGLIASGNTSAGAVHDWLAAHRGPDAEAVMRLDPRYTFFRLTPDDGREPAGAAGAPLIPGRSLAVDAARHPYGELLWIATDAPSLPGARPAYRRLAVALDTGGAIKGEVRADLYLGRGPEAGDEAGRVRHVLRLYRLVPIAEGAP